MNPAPRLGFYLKLVALGAVLASVLALAGPLLRPGFPGGHDGTPHVTYTYLFDQALQQHQFPVRWVELLRDGHSQPLFNFYQPGFYYLVQLTHLVVPSLALSFKLTIVLLWWFGSLFIFLLLCRRGLLAAALAALVFAFSPYLLLDVFVRAAYPELAAIALAPVVLWSIDRFLRTRDARDALVVSFCLALMLLCHLPSVLILTPVFAGYAWCVPRSGRHWLSGAAGLALAALLACGMAAFYVMPALTEIDFIAMSRLTQGDFDYRRHFVYPIQWIRFAWGYGASIPGPDDTMSLQIGLVQWAMLLGAGAALAAATLAGARLAGTRLARATWAREARRIPAETRRQLGLWLGLIALAMFLMTGASRMVWEALPPLAYVQYPWRFHMVITLGAAALAGLLLSLVRGQTAQAVILILAVGLHWQLYRDHLAPSAYLSEQDYPIDKTHWADASTGRTDAFIESGYTPVEATRLPSVPVGRWTIASGQDGAVEEQVIEYDRLRLSAASPAGMRLTFNSHWFPGWKAWIDGRETPITIVPELGYLQVEVPAGSHIVEARFTDTPVRTYANRLSAASLSLWGLLAATQSLWSRGRRREVAQARQQATSRRMAA